MTSEIMIDPRHPRRFEKKKNMGPGCPWGVGDMRAPDRRGRWQARRL